MSRPGGAYPRRRGPGLRTALVVAGLVGVAPPGVLAEQVFRWIDDQGQLHLSDRPPPPGVGRMQQFAVPSYAPPAHARHRDPAAIFDQAERLAEARREREREREQTRLRERELALRVRELDARTHPGHRVYAPVVIHPRRLHHPHWRGHGPDGPPRTARPRSLWEPDHPVYRGADRPRPAASRRSQPAGRIPAPR